MGQVYCIEAEGHGTYKLGVTDGCIERRMKSLQTGSFCPLRLVFAVDCPHPRTVEARLHAEFGSLRLRLRLEWFTLCPEDVARAEEMVWAEAGAQRREDVKQPKSEQRARWVAWLRKRMNEKGLTFVAVGDACGVKPSTVQNWLQGGIPGSHFVASLCGVLEVSADELVAAFSRAKS